MKGSFPSSYKRSVKKMWTHVCSSVDVALSLEEQLADTQVATMRRHVQRSQIVLQEGQAIYKQVTKQRTYNEGEERTIKEKNLQLRRRTYN